MSRAASLLFMPGFAMAATDLGHRGRERGRGRDVATRDWPGADLSAPFTPKD